MRDEAAAGRDSGRLVPVLIEPVSPPMGFRQYQNLDFSGWKGRGNPSHMAELLASIDGTAGPSSEAPSPAPPKASPRLRLPGSFPTRWLIAGAVAMLVLLALGIALGARPKPSVPVVAVAAGDPSPGSQALARDMLVKLGRLLPADATAMQLVQQTSGTRPHFTFQVSGSVGERQSAASIAMTGRNQVLLWSKDFELHDEQLGDLRQQLAITAARVLGCARETLGSEGKLDQQTLKLFLSGCVIYEELSGTSIGAVRGVIPVFKVVTQRAPEFKGAWSRLLLAEAEVVTNSLLLERGSVEEDLRRHIASARNLDPRMPEVLYAETLLVPVSAVRRRIDLANRAIELHPDHAGLLNLRSRLFLAVGRLSAAVQDAKHAAEMDALSPAMRAAYIFAQANSGQSESAKHELAKAEALWPGSAGLNEIRFAINLRYGDPAAALKQLTTGGYHSDIPSSQEALLKARLSRTPENIARAISEAKAAERRTVRQVIQVLAEFGRKEEAIELLLKHNADSRVPFTDVLFRPNTRGLRQDRRFLLVAKRFGLLDYWIKSGEWPDFCFDPELPYNCKAEAAKLEP